MTKNKKEISPTRKKIHEFYEEQEYLSIQQNTNRARSVTVGTAFGGIVELMMRSDYATVWAQMQPVEAIELMEQIAAGCGVEIAMRPKQNFSSWRGWQEVINQEVRVESIEWKGTAPYQLRQQDETNKLIESQKKETSTSRKRKNSTKKVNVTEENKENE